VRTGVATISNISVRTIASMTTDTTGTTILIPMPHDVT